MNSPVREKEPNNFPQHLSEFLKVTPSGITKLIAAWDGLSIESQILILTEMQRRNMPCYFTDKIHIKALESKNSYIRYLAAKKLRYMDSNDANMQIIKKRIEEDHDDLVRYSPLEEDGIGISAIFDNELKNPAAFFKLPQAARLAKIRCLSGRGEQIARLFFYAIDHQLKDGTVSEDEIWEILLEYVGKSEFQEEYQDKEYSYDGYGEYLKGKDISALWHLVPKLPIACAYVLVEYLPIGAGLQREIPDDVLKNMDKLLLEQLFWRKDVVLSELRKQVFFQSDEKDGLEEGTEYMLRGAAIAYNVDLTYQEFTEILSKPVKKKVRDLIDLGSARDLSLVLYEAIHDVLFSIDSDEVSSSSWEFARDAQQSFERKFEILKGYQREKQLRELRLYRLAKQAVPWKKDDKGYPPSDELKFLAESVAKNDTWGTFMAFSTAWSKNPRLYKRLEKFLPYVEDKDEDEVGENEIGVNQDHKMICGQLNRLQTQINNQRLLFYVVVVLLLLLLFLSR
jgi:hypothetical protein